MIKPRFYDTRFGDRVREAFDKGELTWSNIEEWETEYNSGIKPFHELGAEKIMRFYVKEGAR